MNKFCSHLIIPSSVIEAAHRARERALMGPCCSMPLEMESAIAAALEEWGFEIESCGEANRLVGPWMSPEQMR